LETSSSPGFQETLFRKAGKIYNQLKIDCQLKIDRVKIDSAIEQNNSKSGLLWKNL